MHTYELKLPHAVNLKAEEFDIKDATERLLLLTAEVHATERVRLKCAVTLLTLENGLTLLHLEKELAEDLIQLKRILRKYYGLSSRSAELLASIIVAPFLKTLYGI